MLTPNNNLPKGSRCYYMWPLFLINHDSSAITTTLNSQLKKIAT